MQKMGYVTYNEVNCIYYQDASGILLKPVEEQNLTKLRPFFWRENFLFKFGSEFEHNIAYISKSHYEESAIRLLPRYTFTMFHQEEWSGFRITGDAIDDFFSPARYFYGHYRKSNIQSADLIYGNIEADKWIIQFDGKDVEIKLQYGDILHKGIASDLKIHPILTVDFDKTRDVEFVFRVLQIIINTLRILRYDTNCGRCSIELFLRDDEKHLSYNGRVIEYNDTSEKDFCPNLGYVSFESYSTLMNRFLQFSALNPEYSFQHFPDHNSFYSHEYSSLSVMKIFAAFENECHLQKEIFEIKDVSRIAEIKETVLRLMNDIPEQNLSEEEKIFLSNVKSQIQSTGTKLGQTKKISNAYAILKEALEGSVEQILFMPGHKYKAPLSNKDVKKIAGHIVELRGKIVHGDYSGNLSKEDSTYIRLLEVIVYAQMAMRAGLNQKEIERIIGAVFSCNYLIQEEMLSGRKE